MRSTIEQRQREAQRVARYYRRRLVWHSDRWLTIGVAARRGVMYFAWDERGQRFSWSHDGP